MEGLPGDFELKFGAVAAIGGEREFEIVHAPARRLEIPAHGVGRIGPETDSIIARIRFQLRLVSLHTRVED